MKKGKMSIYYDKEADYLEIRFGKPTESSYEKLKGMPDTFVRIDEKTGEKKGYAIFNVQKISQLKAFSRRHPSLPILIIEHQYSKRASRTQMNELVEFAFRRKRAAYVPEREVFAHISSENPFTIAGLKVLVKTYPRVPIMISRRLLEQTARRNTVRRIETFAQRNKLVRFVEDEEEQKADQGKPYDWIKLIQQYVREITGV